MSLKEKLWQFYNSDNFVFLVLGLIAIAFVVSVLSTSEDSGMVWFEIKVESRGAEL